MSIGNVYGQPETANDYWVNPGHYGFQPQYRQGYTWRLTTSPAVNYAVDATNFLEEALYRQTSQNIQNNQGLGTFIPVPETPGFESLLQLQSQQNPQAYMTPSAQVNVEPTQSVLSQVLPTRSVNNIEPFDGLLTAFQAEKAQTSTPFQVGTPINSPAWNTDPRLNIDFNTLPSQYGQPSNMPVGYTLRYSVRPLSGWLENAERAGATHIEPVQRLSGRFGNTSGHLGNGQVSDSLGTNTAVGQLGGLYEAGTGASSRYQPGQFMKAYQQANPQPQVMQGQVPQIAPQVVPPTPVVTQPTPLQQQSLQQPALQQPAMLSPAQPTSMVQPTQPQLMQPQVGMNPMPVQGMTQNTTQSMMPNQNTLPSSSTPQPVSTAAPYGQNYSHLSMLSSSTRGLLEDSATALPGIEAQLQSLVTEAQQQTAAKKGQMQGVEQAAQQTQPPVPQAYPSLAPQPTQPQQQQPIMPVQSPAPQATTVNLGAVNDSGERAMAQSKINQLYQQGQHMVRLYQSGLLQEAEANQILSEINTALYTLMQRYGLEPVQVAQAIQAQQQMQQQAQAAPSMPVAPTSTLEDRFPRQTNASNTEPPSRRGMMLAQLNRQVASQMNSTGWCYKGVARAAERMGISLTGASAYMAADQLAKRQDFKEVTPGGWIPPQQLPTLVKPGDIVVYDRGSGKPHGHIATVLGQENGQWKEASDHVSNLNVNYPTGRARVFRPLDTQTQSNIA